VHLFATPDQKVVDDLGRKRIRCRVQLCTEQRRIIGGQVEINMLSPAIYPAPPIHCGGVAGADDLGIGGNKQPKILEDLSRRMDQ
jgi:hypothetical protein